MFGIDLGTTNSLISIFENGVAKIIPNVLGDHLTPSIVGINDDGSILIGKAARDRLITHPQLTTANFKRKMGSDQLFFLGQHKFRPEELSAFILKGLKADAETYVGHEIKDCVVSVPAYFNDIQRKAVRAAGTLAGLEVSRVINEPTAAAITYGLHQKKSETQYLILDIGGGTFDVSLLEFFDGVLEIKASSGDNYLGGEDFLNMIYVDFLIYFELTEKNLSAKEINQLKQKAEECKHQFNTHDIATIEMIINQKKYSYECKFANFCILSKNLMARFRGPIIRVLRDSKTRESEIDEIVLVGGASRMRIIQDTVTKMFNKTSQVSFNPDEAIALGAAIQAGLKEMDADMPDIILTDVCPYTLGIGSMVGEELCYSPIIERNTTIPVSISQTFYKRHDMQDRVEIEIFQGESLRLADNILLGDLVIKLPIGEGTVNKHAVEVRFTYDVSGILAVDVKIDNTQIHKNIALENNPGLLNEDEINERLKALEKLKIHPRESTENVILINHAQKIYELLLGDDREDVKQALLQFKTLLDTQNIAKIDEGRILFREYLAGYGSPLTIVR